MSGADAVVAELPYPTPLVGGVLLRRYKRFLADVRLDDGRDVTAHCSDPGRMKDIAVAGRRVWLSASDNPKRKLKWSWEIATTADGISVGVRSALPNALVGNALRADALAPFTGYRSIRAEVKTAPKTRADFVLSEHPEDPRPCTVEVKSVTLRLPTGELAFPDAPSERARRHLDVLAEAVRGGERAALVYIAQRNDGTRVVPAAAIDPGYAERYRAAVDAGVEVYAWAASVRPTGVTLWAQRLETAAQPA